jgi:hypothetical protein
VFPTFGGLSAGAGWQDLKLSVEHLTHWKKIALVTDVEWMFHLVRLFGWMTPGELRHFPSTSATRPWTGLRPTEPVPAAIRGLTDLGRFGSGSQRLRIRDAGYGGHDGGIKIVSIRRP